MPVKKFRDVSEIPDVWHEPGSARLYAAIRHVWSLADRICPLRFPAGVFKHASPEAADLLREEWEEANFRAHRARMQASSTRDE